MSGYEIQALYLLIGMILLICTFPFPALAEEVNDCWEAIGLIGCVVVIVLAWPLYVLLLIGGAYRKR